MISKMEIYEMEEIPDDDVVEYEHHFATKEDVAVLVSHKPVNLVR